MPTANEIAACLGGEVEDLEHMAEAALLSARHIGLVHFLWWADCRWALSPTWPGNHVSYLEVFPGGRIVLHPARSRGGQES